jgi:lipopolysaccharide export system ATP-binding protein
MTVRENLLAILETLPLSAEERDERAEELLKDFSLTERASQKAFTLSGGERRRLEIARGLLLSPKFLLLDEPFSGIDPIAVLEIQKIIARLKERGIGVLLTDHNVRETLRITDRAYILSQGEIYRADTPERLVADPEVRRIYLGNDFKLH